MAITAGQDQLPVGVLDQDAEQRPLGLKSGAMDVGLDRGRQRGILRRRGEGQVQGQLDLDGLVVLLDRPEGDGSLGVVGGVHGRSP